MMRYLFVTALAMGISSAAWSQSFGNSASHEIQIILPEVSSVQLGLKQSWNPGYGPSTANDPVTEYVLETQFSRSFNCSIFVSYLTPLKEIKNIALRPGLDKEIVLQELDPSQPLTISEI